MNENAIWAAFDREGERRGGELFLPPQAIVRMLEQCDAEDVAMVGLEAARFERDATIPLLDFIADFSELQASDWREFRTGCNESARAFVSTVPIAHDVFLSATLLTAAEWSRR